MQKADFTVRQTEKQIRDTEELKRINAVTKRTFPEAVAGYDSDLIRKALRRKNVRDDILLHGRCPEIVTLVKNI